MGEKLEDFGLAPPPKLTFGSPEQQREYQRMLQTPLPQGMAHAEWVETDGTWHGWNQQTGQPMRWNTATGTWEVSR
jgi:hypothetical protein